MHKNSKKYGRFAQKLRRAEIKSKSKKNNKHDIRLILDNVYDTFNVGGMYRVADAAGVSHIYHCSNTPMPPNPKITRSSVGLYQYIPHSHYENTLALCKKLKQKGYFLIALEQTPISKHFNTIEYPNKMALIAGNETFGVAKNVINICDLVIDLPMFGINKSLNVVVAVGIVLYRARGYGFSSPDKLD